MRTTTTLSFPARDSGPALALTPFDAFKTLSHHAFPPAPNPGRLVKHLLILFLLLLASCAENYSMSDMQTVSWNPDENQDGDTPGGNTGGESGGDNPGSNHPRP